MNQGQIRIAVFISGGGTNLQALIDASKTGKLSAEISLVVSSNANAFGLTRAKNAEISTFVFKEKKYESKSEASQDLLEKLKESKIDYIALAGYLRLLSPELISAYNGKIINMHPALLPKYGGQGMYGRHVHEAVLASGDKETGVTFHIVDEAYDHGRIIEQFNLPVLENDTPESLQERVLIKEHEEYPKILGKFIRGEYDNN
ncbi:MAG: phosphoribosylglycinamide formyltransferase [candidate division Zixibacteria bacterium]|nr:phosphoribosylglycinamide formyltransferase [candidate division Zixibacteria bacterium]